MLGSVGLRWQKTLLCSSQLSYSTLPLGIISRHHKPRTFLQDWKNRFKYFGWKLNIYVPIFKLPYLKFGTKCVHFFHHPAFPLQLLRARTCPSLLAISTATLFLGGHRFQLDLLMHFPLSCSLCVLGHLRFLKQLSAARLWPPKTRKQQGRDRIEMTSSNLPNSPGKVDRSWQEFPSPKTRLPSSIPCSSRERKRGAQTVGLHSSGIPQSQHFKLCDFGHTT